MGITFLTYPARNPCCACCAFSDALEGHVATLVGAEVARTLAKCGGLGEVAARLQQAQVDGEPGRRGYEALVYAARASFCVLRVRARGRYAGVHCAWTLCGAPPHPPPPAA